MTKNEALQWTEKLASGVYDQQELDLFLDFIKKADEVEVEAILEAYYMALNNQETYSITVRPDFMNHFKSLKPQGENQMPAPVRRITRFHFPRRMQVAAAVLIIIISGLAYRIINLNKSESNIVTAKNTIQKILSPAGNKAVLTLADGSLVMLDQVKGGDVASQNGIRVIKLDSNILSYHNASVSGSRHSEVDYNTVVVPRGGQYQLILADGSHVWLNSASSLKFPTSFIGTIRKVELTGEGYFEVTKDAAKPFIVSAGTVQVNVLGTHFNVMAYPDEEAVKTTLIEGSVKLAHEDKYALIHPGEQGSLTNHAGNFNVHAANINEVIAWKEGRFRFDEMNIKPIMRQIARWYDVDVEYTGDLSEISLSGSIPRKEDVYQLLKALEMSKRVKFETDGNKIIVKPY